ncbi:hypothetical protein [Cupriavidus sp. TMH.W2]|uniref:hypothetical protein n=1 Tax=Cupriavidus sp. TMH.W2 TaxID=3434465 RepID=UPI003D76B24D
MPRAKRLSAGHYEYRSRRILRAFGDHGLWRVYRLDGTHDWAVSFGEAKRIVDQEHVPSTFCIARDRVQQCEGVDVTTRRWWDGRRFVAARSEQQAAQPYRSHARAQAALTRMVQRHLAFADECTIVEFQ